MDKQANDADDHNDDGDGNTSDDQRWSYSLFVINPPLVSGVAVDGTDTGDCWPGRYAAFVLLVAFLLTHYFYYTK